MSRKGPKTRAQRLAWGTGWEGEDTPSPAPLQRGGVVTTTTTPTTYSTTTTTTMAGIATPTLVSSSAWPFVPRVSGSVSSPVVGGTTPGTPRRGIPPIGAVRAVASPVASVQRETALLQRQVAQLQEELLPLQGRAASSVAGSASSTGDEKQQAPAMERFFQLPVNDVCPVIIKSVSSISFDPRDFQRQKEASGIYKVETTFRFGAIQDVLINPVTFAKGDR